MTILEIYVLFGLPLILLGMGFGAVWLVNNDYRKLDERRKAAKQAGG